MLSSQQIFAKNRANKSDISAHLGILHALAAGCESVVEFGTRSGMSTSAFLAARPRWLVCYDLSFDHIDREAFIDAAEAQGTTIIFVEMDTSTLYITPADMLFVDTVHTYAHVKREIRNNHNLVRRYMVFHDTALNGQVSEDKTRPGVLAAIWEFLAGHPEWEVIADLQNQNGLMILERVR